LDKTLENNLIFGKEKEKTSEENGLKNLTLSKLKNLLKKAIEAEDYEKASEIRDEINSRNDN